MLLWRLVWLACAERSCTQAGGPAAHVHPQPHRSQARPLGPAAMQHLARRWATCHSRPSPCLPQRGLCLGRAALGGRGRRAAWNPAWPLPRKGQAAVAGRFSRCAHTRACIPHSIALHWTALTPTRLPALLLPPSYLRPHSLPHTTPPRTLCPPVQHWQEAKREAQSCCQPSVSHSFLTPQMSCCPPLLSWWHRQGAERAAQRQAGGGGCGPHPLHLRPRRS